MHRSSFFISFLIFYLRFCFTILGLRGPDLRQRGCSPNPSGLEGRKAGIARPQELTLCVNSCTLK